MRDESARALLRRRPIFVFLTGIALAMGMAGARGEAADRPLAVGTTEVEATEPESAETDPVTVESPTSSKITDVGGTQLQPVYEGVMDPPDGYLVTVSGTPLRLAPGVRIRDENNRLVLPGTLQTPVPVQFSLDYLGQILRVQIIPDG